MAMLPPMARAGRSSMTAQTVLCGLRTSVQIQIEPTFLRGHMTLNTLKIGLPTALLSMMLALAAAPCMLGQPFNASMFTTTSAAFDSYATTMKFADVNGD